MSRLVNGPFPPGTVVELYPPRGISGSGEPTMAPVATGTVAAVAGSSPAQHEVAWSAHSHAGPAIATAIVGGKRVSVRFRVGG